MPPLHPKEMRIGYGIKPSSAGVTGKRAGTSGMIILVVIVLLVVSGIYYFNTHGSKEQED